MKTKKGIALVMANADYVQQNKLPACKKDGEDIKEVLEYLNFDVISGLDLDRTDMYEIISNFIDEAKSYSTVLVYYSGHGVQITTLSLSIANIRIQKLFLRIHS